MNFKLCALILSFASASSAQQKYFVDGFHGGVYGHYPLETYTQFIVEQIEKYPDWYIGLEIEPETWDTVMVRTPDAYRAFQRKMETGQAEYTNPAYAQSYLYCISGESIIRQFYYGITKLRRHFPNVLIATYSVEEPCFTSCLPGILSGFGFRHIVLKCPDTCWGGYVAPFGGELVNLIGPDGTSMLSVPRYACEELEKNSVWQTTAWTNNPKYYQACFDYGIKHPAGMTYQDAGWTKGPWIGYGSHQNGTEYTRWTKYIEEQSNGSATEDHRFSQEDVRPGLMWGSQVLQLIARQCRRSEHLIPQAEKMAAMARMTNGFRPRLEDLDEAWRTLMLSQHHDCWIVPYNRLNERGTWADNVALWTAAADGLAQSVISEAVQSYGNQGEPVLRVFNTSGFAREEVVTVTMDDGRIQPVFVSVPSFGFANIPISEVRTPGKKHGVKSSSKECTLQNDQLSITLDLQRGGIVKSLRLKSDGYEYACRQGFTSMGELRGYFAEQKRFVSSAEKPAAVRIIEDNELVRSIEITGDIAGTVFRKTITLRKGSPVIDCTLDIDWTRNQRIGDFTRPLRKAKNDRRTTFYDSRYALSLMLPSSLPQPRLFKSAPFDVCESSLENTFYNSWDSIKHNLITEWIDLKPAADIHGLALFSDHTTSYGYGPENPLSLTVQYSGPGLWGREYELTQPTRLRYALVPHTDEWDRAGISRLNTAWNEPLIVVPGRGRAGETRSLLNAEDSGYELTSVNTNGDDILVRFFNSSGCEDEQDIRLGVDAASVVETDFLGENVDLSRCRLEQGSVLCLSMPRFAVRTFRIRWN